MNIMSNKNYCFVQCYSKSYEPHVHVLIKGSRGDDSRKKKQTFGPADRSLVIPARCCSDCIPWLG